MTVFQVLAEVIRPVELLRLVALSKLVDVVQMLSSDVPLRWVWKFFTAIATNVSVGGRRCVECCLYA
jgi:hypothetical protein